MKKFATVDQVRVIETRGPFKSKSGGNLAVRVQLPISDITERYFVYDQAELDAATPDIRGLRIYSVRDIAKGCIGALEFHKIREETVLGLDGKIKWTCEDLYGGKTEHVLTGEMGLWLPPYILHTYESLEDGSGLIVLANTLYEQSDPKTHDSFSVEAFRELQATIN